jgi:predicted esterase
MSMGSFLNKGLSIVGILAIFFPASRMEAEDIRKILQAEGKIIIDGSLSDWRGIEEFPINRTPSGETAAVSGDIRVTARFTFDAKRFYAAVEVRDDVLEFPNRSWRYGDGLLLTLLDPHRGTHSDRFYSFGVSLEGKKPVFVLLNRNGTYFPPISLNDILFHIEKDTKAGVMIYEIAIPFSQLQPFRPFIHPVWGVNLVYADRDEGDRQILQLHPDPEYDTEYSHMRRGEIFSFVPRASERAEAQGILNAGHYFDDSPKVLILGAQSPRGGGEWTLRYNLISPHSSTSGRDTLRIDSGMNRLEWPLVARDYPSGAYTLSVALIDERGSLLFTQDNPFVVLNRGEMEQFDSRYIDARNSEEYIRDPKFRSSLPTVEIRMEWISRFMQEASPYTAAAPLLQWIDDLEFLMERIEESRPALFLNGRIGRLAHRSEIDGTLQPYSVYVPDFMEPEEALPLYVVLHGSGVDETWTIRSTAQALYDQRLRGGTGRMIVLAPQARGLSDWYVGDSERDVMECVAHVKTLYNIDEARIILDGFSMGGYGAWRLGLKHPEVFKAVVVRSGAVSPPQGRSGDSILNLMRPGISNSFLVVHGAKDNAVSVENARTAVRKLEELGIDFKYLELKDAAHGDYDKWDDILRWLKGKVGWKESERPERKTPRIKR